MKSAKLFRKGIALLLCSTFLLGDVATLNAAGSEPENTTKAGNVVYYSANLFNYDRNKMNDATDDMSGDKKLKFIGDDGFLGFFSDSASYNTVGAGTGDYYTVHQGIAKSELNSDGMIEFNYAVADLFNIEANTERKISYENVQIPFVYDENGHMIFDSDEYQYKLQSENDEHSLTMEKVDNSEGFFPFEKKTGYKQGWFGQQQKVEYNDCWFGMDFSIDFTMNEYGTVDGKEFDGTNATRFEFSGDDDVWVFVDDKLVLDLGGIHQEAEGYIDFVEKKAVVTSNVYKDGKSSKEDVVVELSEGIFNNDMHKLSIFYLERGAGDSNCKIKFNMPTITEDENIVSDVSFNKSNMATKGAIEGAEFTLYSDISCADEFVLAKATSDENGVVFEDVPTGVYYMKETKTPSGFVDDGAIYKVIVSGNSSENVIYYIKDEDGATVEKNMNGEYVIYNEPNGTKEFTVGKSDSVVDYDERVYKVDLEATAPINYVQTEKNANVVLVLDVSGSMCNHLATIINVDTKEEAFQELNEFSVPEGTKYYYDRTVNEKGEEIKKEVVYENGQWHKWVNSQKVQIVSAEDMPATLFVAERDEVLIRSAKEFVRILEKDSPESYVSVITFANSDEQAEKEPEKYKGGEAIVQCELSKVKDNLDDIEAAIEKAQANTMWCTYPSYGLNLAVEQFDSINNDNANYTVFFTDGDPTGALVTEVDATERQKSIDISTTLKTNYDSVVYAVGIDVTDTTYLNEVATKDCCIQLDDMSELATSLRSISHSIVDTISNATIYDYINDRFEVVVQNEDGTYTKANVGDDVSIREDQIGILQMSETEGYYVVWENQIIGSGSETSPKWTDAILLRAKDDFLGGNAVATNKSNSGVLVDNNFTPFPMPTVNVKTIKDEIEKEITYFLGDTIEVENLIQELSDELLESTIGLNMADLETLLTDGTVSVDYSYNNDGDILGELVYTISATGETAQFEKHEATKVGESVEIYTLSVEYVPYAPAERADMNPDQVVPGEDDGAVVESASLTGKYFVNVIEGALVITKNFDKDFISNLPYSQREKELVNANQTAVFTVYRYENEDALKEGKVSESFDITITNGRNNNSVTVKHMKSGIYKVEENTNWSWKYVLNGTEDSYENASDGVVYFGIENDEIYDMQNVDFMNEMSSSMWFADTTNRVNEFK